MKTTFKFAFAICMALFVSIVTANAQAVTTGTISFNVTVADAFDLRSNGASTGTGGSTGFSANLPQSPNDALGVVLSVGDASPNVANNTLTASVPIRMRSNRNYIISATRAGTSAASATDFEASDISMGLTSVSRTGANVDTGGTDTIATGWATGGTKKVGDLNATPQTILSGSRISNGGNNLSGDNFATSSVEFSVVRAYYTPTATPYTEQVTLVISAP